MEYVILGLLMTQSMTLYSLNKAFRQSISLFYSPSLGSLQSAVKRLLDKGWIVSEDTVEAGRNKKNLTITPEGRSAFKAWMVHDLDPGQLEVSFLSRLFFMGLIEPKAARQALLANMKKGVALSRDTLLEKHQEISHITVPDAYAQVFAYQVKVLQYGLDTHQYALSWIEALEMDLP